MKLSADDLVGLLKVSRHDPACALQRAPSVLLTVNCCLNQLGDVHDDSAAPTCHVLLQALRVLRNLCAVGGQPACQQILQGGALEAVGRLLDAVERAVIQLDWQLPLVAAQLLANAANAGPGCAAAVWKGSFPRQLNTLAHINSGPAQSALTLCLLTCCRKVPGAAEALCSPAGAAVLAPVLCGQHRLHGEGQQSNDNLGLLLSFLCFQRGLLPSLAAALASPLPSDGSSHPTEAQGVVSSRGSSSNTPVEPQGFAASGGSSNPTEAQGLASSSGGGSTPAAPHGIASGSGAAAQAGSTALVAAAAKAVAMSPSVSHVVLLQELSCEAQLEGHLAFEGNDEGEGGRSSMEFLVELVRELALAAKSGLLSEGQQQVLQDALQLMRDIAGNEEGLTATSSPSQRASLVLALCQAGMLPLLLAMLKALAPIRSPQHPQHGSSGASSSSLNGEGSSSVGVLGQDLPVAELAPALAEHAKQLPSRPPYFGYRTDILSVLANASYGRPSVKSDIQSLGGVELVLCQCQMDRESPLAREWALWAVRNLCEGNEAAQAAIRELQLCTAVETEEARQLGVKLELDKGTGKLKVVQQRPPQPQQ